LAAAIADSRLVVYTGLAHSPHWEEPDQVAAEIAAFAERVTPR
jgi:pimeloyl-ACP methyl ester carboxylesterase